MQLEDQQLGSTSPSQQAVYDFPSRNVYDQHRTLGIAIDDPSNQLDYIVLKRLMDIFLVLLLSPILMSICAFTGLLVVLNSPGPIFFSHRRILRGGLFFSMWKFRTMCVNSSEVLEHYLAQNPEARKEWETSHKLRNDPRITQLGATLRKYSLDELPQFWNVLTGKMSLVGPRPIVAAEVEKYADKFVYYCAVKPGITGLWQVSGRSTLSYQERVDLDCKYVAEWSLWMDIKILCRTLHTVIKTHGAF